MLGKTFFLLYVFYCFEVGIFLIFYPWMALWEQNSLLTHYPVLRTFVLNDFVRGAVSGLGIANLFLGVWELGQFQQYFRKA